MTTKVTYLMRVWLPDRPGALSAVASRLGALRGDVVGLEIIERGGGMAIDDLLVTFPASTPAEGIMRELHAEEEVQVEQIRQFDDSDFDPELYVLDAASSLLVSTNATDLAISLAGCARHAVRATWACVVDSTGLVLGSSGECPSGWWLECFIAGSPPVTRAAGLDRSASMDTVWMALPSSSVALVVGSDRVIRARDAQRLTGLAGIADLRLAELADGATPSAQCPNNVAQPKPIFASF